MNRSTLAELGRFVYWVDAASTSYRRIDQVPDFWQQSIPYFGALIVVEYLILWMQGKPRPRVNDTVTSLSLGLIQECAKIVMRGTEMIVYIYVYEHYRLIDLPWDSAATWYLTALLLDFGFYWVHRASHEINILWAMHQVHHSSDDFNLAVGVRHAAVNSWISWIIYTPLALFIPPAQFLTHQQFNLLFQFTVHTEVIDRLGPLEWIFNTPSHHRVHHGSNKYLLDKNYGGVLIVWDRLFGTFQHKLPEETIYGLVFPPHSFNPIKLQTYYYPALWTRLKTFDNWQNRIEAAIKGPSWTPGSPWTGWQHLKFNVTARPKYDVPVPWWYNLYISIHFVVLVTSFQFVVDQGLGALAVNLFIGYTVASLTGFALLLENVGPRSCTVEWLRCLLFLAVDSLSLTSLPFGGAAEVIRVLFYLSTAVWSFKILEYATRLSTRQPKVD